MSATLTSQVRQHLVQLLSSQAIAVGQALNASQIAQELGCSHTTVNKAIAEMAKEGWVKTGEGRHAVVVSTPPAIDSGEPVFQHSNRSEDAYQAILERTLNGDFAIGDVIKAKPLAEKLDVSLSTVRQALEWLCNDGLFVRLPRRSWQVIRLTRQDVDDIYWIRLRIEPRAVKSAATRMTTATLEQLTSATQQMLAGDASVYARRQHDYQFHRAVLQASESPIFLQTVDPLLRKLMLTVTTERLANPTAYRQHLEILEAIAARDASLAAQRMKSHLVRSAKTVPTWENLA